MKNALLAIALLTAALPARADAIVLDAQTPAPLCAADTHSIVVMPCAKPPAQLQTVRLSLLKAFVPMACRPTGVRFQVAGLPLQPGRAAGLIATAIVRAPSRGAHIDQMCQPTGW